jgi:acetylornithine deacetylase/succinyl-diaminopimelate desuccinylase-like protein
MDALERAIGDRADRAIEIAAELVAIPSDGPAHDERAVVAALVRAAAALGLPLGEVVARERAHPNLLVAIPGKAHGRRLILNSHTDTKPPGDAADPHSAAIRDGRLHGLGSADAKGSVAAMLVAAAAMVAAGLPQRGELLLVFSADEESEGTRGLAHVASAGRLAADAAIVGEPSGMDSSFDGLPVSASGFVGLTVRSDGPRLHSGLARRLGWADPLVTIARAILDLPSLVDLSPRAHGGRSNAIVGDPRLTFTSFGGGAGDGILGGAAWARGEVRTRPGEAIDQIEAALKDGIAELLATRALTGRALSLEVDSVDWPASEVDPSAAIVTALADATEHVTGRRPVPVDFPGATEAHVLAGLGIPTVPAFGPGLLESAHMPDESVAIDDLRTAVGIYARTAAAFLR